MQYIWAIPGLIGFVALWWLLESHGYKRRQNTPRYYRCTGNHNHKTPAAAVRCSAGQRGRARY